MVNRVKMFRTSNGVEVEGPTGLSWLEDYYKKITGYATPVPDEPAPPSFSPSPPSFSPTPVEDPDERPLDESAGQEEEEAAEREEEIIERLDRNLRIPDASQFDRHIHEQADEAGPSSRPVQRAEDEDDKYTDAEILEYLRLHKRPPNFRSQEVDKRRMCEQLMDDADAVVLKRPIYRSASFEIFDRTNGKW